MAFWLPHNRQTELERMRKILIGLLAAAVIAAGGLFGFQYYLQHRVAAEVETAFAGIRAAGGKASHGPVSFDLWTRILTIADITAESASQPPVAVKIANLTARGVGQPDPARFSADSIEAGNVEIAMTMAVQDGLRVTYRAPQIAVAGYSGPAGPFRPLDGTPGDLYRFLVEQFSAITAASVTAPS